MRAYSQPACLFRGELGIYFDTIRLIRTPELGAGVARALGKHRAVLMKSHGVALACASIEESVICAIMLENAAMIQMLVEASGESPAEFAREDIAELRDQLAQPDQFAVNFAYLARRLKRRA